MKHIFQNSVAAAGVLAAAALGLSADAGAAPAGPPSVADTIDQLRAQGYQVIVNRVGNAAPADCTLRAIHPGQTFTRTDSGVPGAGDDIVITVVTKTVYVDITC